MLEESPEKSPYWDKEELLKRVMNNHDLVNTLLTVFIEDMPKILNNLVLAAEDNNLEQIVLEAHNLKGYSYNLTANKIGDLAKEIEAAGKDRNLNYINALLPMLIEQFKLTVEHFESLLANK